MKVLLDTHVLLWLVMDDPRLSHPAKEVLVAEEHKLFFSIVSLWEITIKQSINKLELAGD